MCTNMRSVFNGTLLKRRQNDVRGEHHDGDARGRHLPGLREAVHLAHLDLLRGCRMGCRGLGVAAADRHRPCARWPRVAAQTSSGKRSRVLQKPSEVYLMGRF